ncbi:MAG: bifunctional enoyl-CoA hydratase/phosphate acetyltransferase [Geminicoccaceae bacterium]
MAHNRTYDQIQVGDTASIEHVCTANDVFIFAQATGNLNPAHLPRPGDEDGLPDPDQVMPSMYLGSLFSNVFGNNLPGFGTLYKTQNLNFVGRAHVGDQLTVSIEVKEKRPDNVVFCTGAITNQNGEMICTGEAELIAPTEPIEYDMEMPGLFMRRNHHFNHLINALDDAEPLATSVVCPNEENSLGGAVLSHQRGLIKAVLVGSRVKIEAAAQAEGFDLSGMEIEDIEDPHQAAARAVAMVHEGRVEAVMKGNIHSDELLGEVVKKNGGLRAGRRVCHVFVMDVPGRHDLLIVSDAAINIQPDLRTKVDIVQNAIDMANAIGMREPRVGILSAVETINEAIPSTLDAAILCKMADRGQIKGGIVDGPLAMDNAIDLDAAKTKGIRSLVAGHAEVLITPNLEAGNMLAKELTFLAHAEAAGLVLGAKVPVILTSRADSAEARLASCALAMYYQHYRKTGQPLQNAATESFRSAAE